MMARLASIGRRAGTVITGNYLSVFIDGRFQAVAFGHKIGNATLQVLNLFDGLLGQIHWQ